MRYGIARKTPAFYDRPRSKRGSEELTEYVEELLDNDEDYEGDYPVIKKVDKTIHVYFD